VPVTITGEEADERNQVRARIDAAIALINAHADQLDPADVNIIHNVKSITASDWLYSFIDVRTGRFNLLFSDVLNPGMSTAFLATDIAHDAYHVTQHRRWMENTPENAPLYERQANAFSMRPGKIFGLTPDELNVINSDRHTFYNPSHDPYP